MEKTKTTFEKKDATEKKDFEKDVEVLVTDMKKKKEDFFYVKPEPGVHHYWGERKERSVETLKRAGYEVDPSVDSKAAREKVQNQRDYIDRKLNDPNTKKEEVDMLKDMRGQLSVSNVDTTTNIPEMILMRIPEEKYQKRQAAKRILSDKQGEQIDHDIKAVSEEMQKSGLGGIAGMTEAVGRVMQRKEQSRRRKYFT